MSIGPRDSLASDDMTEVVMDATGMEFSYVALEGTLDEPQIRSRQPSLAKLRGFAPPDSAASTYKRREVGMQP